MDTPVPPRLQGLGQAPSPSSPCNRLPWRAIPLLSRHLLALFWKDFSALELFRKKKVFGTSASSSEGTTRGGGGELPPAAVSVQPHSGPCTASGSFPMSQLTNQKSSTTTNGVKGAKKLKASYFAGGNTKWCSHVGKQCGSSLLEWLNADPP